MISVGFYSLWDSFTVINPKMQKSYIIFCFTYRPSEMNIYFNWLIQIRKFCVYIQDVALKYLFADLCSVFARNLILGKTARSGVKFCWFVTLANKKIKYFPGHGLSVIDRDPREYESRSFIMLPTILFGNIFEFILLVFLFTKLYSKYKIIFDHFFESK